MALEKTIMTNFGVNVNYWRIVQVNECFLEGRRGVHFTLFPYATAEARQDGAQPFSQPFERVITPDNEAYHPEMTREMIYEYIKTLPEFEGAKDV